jgi:hypothetical protein
MKRSKSVMRAPVPRASAFGRDNGKAICMPDRLAPKFAGEARYARKLWPIRWFELADPPPVVVVAGDVIDDDNPTGVHAA